MNPRNLLTSPLSLIVLAALASAARAVAAERPVQRPTGTGPLGYSVAEARRTSRSMSSSTTSNGRGRTAAERRRRERDSRLRRADRSSRGRGAHLLPGTASARRRRTRAGPDAQPDIYVKELDAGVFGLALPGGAADGRCLRARLAAPGRGPAARAREPAGDRRTRALPPRPVRVRAGRVAAALGGGRVRDRALARQPSRASPTSSADRRSRPR